MSMTKGFLLVLQEVFFLSMFLLLLRFFEGKKGFKAYKTCKKRAKKSLNYGKNYTKT
jgi:hypothetical protein